MAPLGFQATRDLARLLNVAPELLLGDIRYLGKDDNGNYDQLLCAPTTPTNTILLSPAVAAAEGAKAQPLRFSSQFVCIEILTL